MVAVAVLLGTQALASALVRMAARAAGFGVRFIVLTLRTVTADYGQGIAAHRNQIDGEQ